MDFTWSVSQSRSVLWLKPNRASNLNCNHHASGRPGSPSKTMVATKNSAPLHAAPGAKPLNFAHSIGSSPLNTMTASTAVSKISSKDPNRLFAKV